MNRKDVEDYEVAITLAQCGLLTDARKMLKRIKNRCYKHWYSRMPFACSIKKKKGV